ncbi:MAG: hypothetical protein JW885_05595 [Deltaproteobacteria bacterium]|nr:hypothetical protein [Candidatus Zymogenaceae bacterium]
MRISVPVLAALALSLVIIPTVLAQNVLAADGATHRDVNGTITMSFNGFVLGITGNGSAVLAEGPPPGEPKPEPKPVEKKGADYIKEWDKNGDGKISKDEFMGSPEQLKALDKNKNGYITKKEAKDIPPDMMMEKGGPHDSPGDPQGPPPEGPKK